MDLIEMMRDRAKDAGGDKLLEEAADALAAAREDGERLDFIVGMWSRNLTPELAAVVEAFRDGSPDRTRAAIDQARGKGRGGSER